MSNAMGNHLEDALLNHTFGKSTYIPSAIYASLFTDAGSLAELEAGNLSNEISGTNYTRILIPSSSWTISNGVAINNMAITFSTASGSWGTIKFMALLNVSNDVLFYGELSSTILITDNTFSFDVGDLSITIDS